MGKENEDKKKDNRKKEDKNKNESSFKSIKPVVEKILTENDLLKYEIAEELGLIDKVRESGWKSLTARESGRIGGILAKRKKERSS